jgi:hypothetical protein
MESHQNESQLLASRSGSFHSFSYMLFNSNLNTQRWLQQFRYTICVHRPARFVGIHIQINCFIHTSKSQEGVNSCFQGEQCCVHQNFAPNSYHLFVTQIYHSNSSSRQGRVATTTIHNRTRMNRHWIEHQLGIPMCINIHSFHFGIRHQQ